MARPSSCLLGTGVLFFVLIFLTAASALEVNGQALKKFCSLFEPANHGKVFTSTALMFRSTVARVDGDDSFLYSPDCNEPDYFAIPEGSQKVWRKWTRFFDSLPSGKHLILEITFEGRPDIETAHLFGSLDGWSRAQIVLSKIISVKDVTRTTGIAARLRAKAPEVERIEVLLSTLSNFLGSLHAPRATEQTVLDRLSDDFRFVDLGGNLFDRKKYRSMNAPWAGWSGDLQQFSLTRRLLNKSDRSMTWRGTFELLFSSGPSKTYYCDVTLVLRDGNWLIRKAKMGAKR